MRSRASKKPREDLENAVYNHLDTVWPPSSLPFSTFNSQVLFLYIAMRPATGCATYTTSSRATGRRMSWTRLSTTSTFPVRWTQRRLKTLHGWPQPIPAQLLRTRLAAFKKELCDEQFQELLAALCFLLPDKAQI